MGARDEAAFALSPLAAGLAPGELRQAVATAQVHSLRRGQVLFRQGEPAAALFLLTSGRVKLAQLRADGHELIVRLVAPGEPFAGLAVLDGGSYPFDASVLRDGRALAWPRAGLRALFEHLPRFEANVLGVVGAHARQALERVQELASESVAQRLARTLLRLWPLGHDQGEDGWRLDGLTQQDLAEMIASTLYTVSRTLSEWQAQGLVRVGRGRLLLRSRARLTALAEGR